MWVDTTQKLKCKDQEVATGEVGKVEMLSDASEEEKEPKRLKTNEEKVAAPAKETVQRLEELESLECIKTCETDPIPTIIHKTRKWYDLQMEKAGSEAEKARIHLTPVDFYAFAECCKVVKSNWDTAICGEKTYMFDDWLEAIIDDPSKLKNTCEYFCSIPQSSGVIVFCRIIKCEKRFHSNCGSTFAAKAWAAMAKEMMRRGGRQAHCHFSRGSLSADEAASEGSLASDDTQLLDSQVAHQNDE